MLAIRSDQIFIIKPDGTLQTTVGNSINLRIDGKFEDRSVPDLHTVKGVVLMETVVTLALDNGGFMLFLRSRIFVLRVRNEHHRFLQSLTAVRVRCGMVLAGGVIDLGPNNRESP